MNASYKKKHHTMAPTPYHQPRRYSHTIHQICSLFHSKPLKSTLNFYPQKCKLSLTTKLATLGTKNNIVNINPLERTRGEQKWKNTRFRKNIFLFHPPFFQLPFPRVVSHVFPFSSHRHPRGRALPGNKSKKYSWIQVTIGHIAISKPRDFSTVLSLLVWHRRLHLLADPQQNTQPTLGARAGDAKNSNLPAFCVGDPSGRLIFRRVAVGDPSRKSTVVVGRSCPPFARKGKSQEAGTFWKNS